MKYMITYEDGTTNIIECYSREELGSSITDGAEDKEILAIVKM